MKKAFIYSLMVAALAVVSCTKTTLDPLKGIYPEAQQPVITTLVSSSFVKTESARVFHLQFSGENGAAIKTALVGPRAQYYLEPGVYGPGEKNLCFITAGGSTTVNGQAIIDGQISVKKEDDTYRFVFVLFDNAGTAYRTSWKGELVYEPDPEPVKLTKVLVAQKNEGSVTVKLGTADMSVDAMGTPVGDGFALTADIYSADGVLYEGVYTAGDGSTLNPGEFTPGYEFDASSWGMGIFHWGTCWWAGEVATHITSGTIDVARKGSKYIITWGSEATYPNWAVFEGEIKDLEPSEAPAYDGVTLTQNFGIIDYTAYGMKMVGIELGTPGVVATPGGWGNTYSGDGNYLKLEIYSADGKIAPGTYKACAEGGVIGEGEFGIGYDGMYGASGTAWYTLVDGVATYQYITDGTVTVEVDGDDYKITIESSVVNARYGYGEGGQGGDDFDGTVLSQFLGAQDYTAYGVKLAALYLGTDGISVGATGIAGDGAYLKLEYYSTDGSLAAGEYEPCAEGGNVTEGTFGIGYDGQWGESGTTWYTVADGAQTGKYVTDGHLSVSVEGDVYTIVLTSTVINAKYVGKLSAE